jgi:transcriptional repressor NrdR
MFCPTCGHEDTKVLESRLSHEGRSIRRRRSCQNCNYRFTTYEKEEDFVFQVQKRDGRFETYTRDKALNSVEIACQKRLVSREQLESVIDRIERALQEDGERIVMSSKIGDMIMTELQRIDHVAYVRFASVYMDFKNPEQFVLALKQLGNSCSQESSKE